MSKTALSGLVLILAFYFFSCAVRGGTDVPIKLPPDKPDRFYALGIGESLNVEFALRLARTRARTELAQKLMVLQEKKEKLLWETMAPGAYERWKRLRGFWGALRPPMHTAVDVKKEAEKVQQLKNGVFRAYFLGSIRIDPYDVKQEEEE